MIPALLRSFDLRRDQRDPEAIHEAVEAGVRSAGTNLWVLIFAIFIASIGLNVNSTAVIIGAMLISPLMGPIVAIGYGAGVSDFELIKRALRTLGLFALISFSTATVYFLLTPLAQAQSELLARTTPTLWDVLIAFFGGAAGIVALTRRETSNVVPGVAIATALMPPMCTAGYGLAQGKLEYFGGALYLFSINAVFIAFSTLLIVRVLRLPQRQTVHDSVRRRVRFLIGAAVVATLLPSAYLAWDLVRQEFFREAAGKLLTEAVADPRILVLANTVDARARTLTLTLAGQPLDSIVERELQGRLTDMARGTAQLAFRYKSAGQIDLSTLKQELRQDLAAGLPNDAQQRRLQEAQMALAVFTNAMGRRREVLKELQAEFPEATEITVAEGEQQLATDSVPQPTLVVGMRLARRTAAPDPKRLEARLQARFPGERVSLLISNLP
ncbi:DUF389 domain-containing protein [Gemmatimonas aurantiaca]|uniref:DUF389 domain-containing protein n=1 Tax=Gemmatimonas aurantiaca TaxID=173480 RepID=UPI00301BA0F7